MSSILLDPEFDSNGYVYLYYTVPNSNFNRLSRFKANGNLAIPNSELVLINLNELQGVIHNGGAMRWGTDTTLYLSVGDGLLATNSQDQDVLLGKMLRLNRDGSIPTDNPFYNEYTGDARYIYASGLRNSFTFDINPNTGQILANDVGQDNWEEINNILPGKNYGWPIIEGPITNQTAPNNYQDPFYAYPHENDMCAPVGGAFYTPTNNQFPEEWKNLYIFSDYCTGLFQALDPQTGLIVDTLLSGAHWSSSLVVDHDGYLYYSLFTDGEIHKVQYVGNGSPFITRQPTTEMYVVGEDASYSVEIVGNEVLNYQWYKNDQIVATGTDATLTINNIQLVDSGSTIYCKISNNLGTVYSDTLNIKVTTNQRPVINITAPIVNSTYQNGDSLYFEGSATDAEDGALLPNNLTWYINFHHGTHYHPGMNETSGIGRGKIFIDRIGETSTDVWYRVHLRAIDNNGLSNETYVDVFPETVFTDLKTSPANFNLILDGAEKNTDYNFEAVVGNERIIIAPEYQNRNDSLYQFFEWSDGNTNELITFFAGDFSEKTAKYSYLAPYFEGEGTGLAGEYFDNIFWNEPSTVQKIDPEINFQLDYGSFFFGFPGDSITVEWTGSVLAPVTGSYTFDFEFDEHLIVEFNGLEFINANQKGSQSFNVNLTAGEQYNIVIKFKETLYLSEIKMFWSHNYESKQIVPQRFLYPTPAVIVNTNIVETKKLTPFPNPTTNTVNIFFDDSIPYTVSVYNTKGQIVKQQSEDSNNLGFVRLNVSDLASGLYFFSIKNQNDVYVGEFIKTTSK